jgi:hypothetical protein
MNKVGSPALKGKKQKPYSFSVKKTKLFKSFKGGEAGVYTREEGIYSYFEICEKLNVDNWQKKWDNKQQSVYATYDDQWVS